MYPEDYKEPDDNTYQEVPPVTGNVPDPSAGGQPLPDFEQPAYQPLPDSESATSNHSQDSQFQNYYEQTNNSQNRQYNPYTQRTPQPVSGMSIAALILGILSIVFCCCGGVGGIIFGAVGIILAVLSRGEDRMQTNAKIGLGLSITGLVLGFVVVIFLFIAVQSSSKYAATFYRFDNSYSDEIQQSLPDNNIELPYGNSLNDLLQQEGQDF